MPFDGTTFKTVKTNDELLALMRWERDNPPKTWLEGLRRLVPWLRKGHLPVGHGWDYGVVLLSFEGDRHQHCKTVGCAEGIANILWGVNGPWDIRVGSTPDATALFLKGGDRIGKSMDKTTSDDIANLIEEYLLDPEEYMGKENA